MTSCNFTMFCCLKFSCVKMVAYIFTVWLCEFTPDKLSFSSVVEKRTCSSLSICSFKRSSNSCIIISRSSGLIVRLPGILTQNKFSQSRSLAISWNNSHVVVARSYQVGLGPRPRLTWKQLAGKQTQYRCALLMFYQFSTSVFRLV